MKGSNLKSMMLFVVYHSSPNNMTSEGCQGVLIRNYTKATIQAYKKDTLTSFEDEDWQNITSNLEPGNSVEVMVVFEEGFIVEKITISLLYDKPLDKELEQSNAVDEEDVSVIDDYRVDDLEVGKDVADYGEDEVMPENKKRACCFCWR